MNQWDIVFVLCLFVRILPLWRVKWSMGCCCSTPSHTPSHPNTILSSDFPANPPIVYNFYFGTADEASIRAVKEIIETSPPPQSLPLSTNDDL